MTRRSIQLINSFLISKKVQKPFLFITAFPKSGSSFTELVLQELTGYRKVSLAYSYLREQDLDYPKLSKYSNLATITKQHTLATIPNIEIIKEFKISPIIITRKIHNLIPSLRRHISETLQWPFIYVPSNFNTLSISQQNDLLIDFAVPWYFHFFASWKNTQNLSFCDMLFVSYEEFIQDQTNYFHDITSFWSLSYHDSEIQSAIDKTYTKPRKITRHNRNKFSGESIHLSQENLERIHKYAEHYKGIDFSSIL